MQRLTQSGLHPILPMEHVQLGDYGYFDNGQWRKWGNITTIKGYRCHPTVIHNDFRDQEVLIDHGVNVGTDLEAKAACHLGGTGFRLSFEHTNDYYIQAVLFEEITYDSIDVEINEQLKKLKKADRWNDDYYLVVSVIYAKSSFAAFASEDGGSIGFNADIQDVDPTDITNSQVRLSGGAVMNKTGIEIVERKNVGQPHPIAFRTVKYSRAGISGIWRKKLKYAEDANEIKTTSIQGDSKDGEDSPQPVFG